MATRSLPDAPAPARIMMSTMSDYQNTLHLPVDHPRRNVGHKMALASQIEALRRLERPEGFATFGPYHHRSGTYYLTTIDTPSVRRRRKRPIRS